MKKKPQPRRGRPPLDPQGRVRSVRVEFLLLPEERDALRDKAHLEGFNSVASYVRHLALRELRQ